MTTSPCEALAGSRWRDEALCRQTDPELFFPGKGESCEPAKRVCGRCPVLAECLRHALDHGENDGVWGGTSPRQRRALAQQHRPAAPRGRPAFAIAPPHFAGPFPSLADVGVPTDAVAVCPPGCCRRCPS